MRDNLDGTWNAETSATASGLVSICADFQFIISLVITRSILDYARSATVKLQESQLDMFKMFTEVNLLLDAISKVRDKLDLYHSSWYEVTCELAFTVQSEQSKPRTCSRQMNRANPETESIEQYYRVTVSTPLLDHLQSELCTRFSKENCFIIPTLMFQLDESSKMNWRENFSEFCTMYKSDLPNERLMNSEMDLWETFWSSKRDMKNLPARISDTLKQTDPLIFPNIFTMLKILAVLPVTTCSCERSISVLRRMKTYSRSTMTQERLNGLALLHIHRNIELS